MIDKNSQTKQVVITANIDVHIGDLLIFTDKSRQVVRNAIPKQDRAFDAIALNTATVGQELLLIISDEPEPIPGILRGAS